MLQKVPSARTIARLMTIARDHLQAESVTIAAIEAAAPALVEARRLLERFHTMIRKKITDDLDPRIAEAKASLITSFATGITKNKAAVRASIIQPWSNGQTEGQITKLKPVKRQMYGRAKIDLLQARLVTAHNLVSYHRVCVRASFACRITAWDQHRRDELYRLAWILRLLRGHDAVCSWRFRQVQCAPSQYSSGTKRWFDFLGRL
jgi:transposase